MQKSININTPDKEKGVVLKLAAVQAFGTIIFALAMLYCFDSRQALSALLGGLIAVLANLLFALQNYLQKVKNKKSSLIVNSDFIAKQLLFNFYWSETLKVVFTLAMLGICIAVLKVSMLPFIIAYAFAALIINWLYLLLV